MRGSHALHPGSMRAVALHSVLAAGCCTLCWLQGAAHCAGCRVLHTVLAAGCCTLCWLQGAAHCAGCKVHSGCRAHWAVGCTPCWVQVEAPCRAAGGSWVPAVLHVCAYALAGHLKDCMHEGQRASQAPQHTQYTLKHTHTHVSTRTRTSFFA